MIGRFADPTGFREVFRSRDFIRVLGAGLLIGLGLFLQYGWNEPLRGYHIFPLIALVLTGGPIIFGAVKGLSRGKINVDELVSIAIMATLFLGEYTSAAVVAFIMALGGLIEEFTSYRARRSIEGVIQKLPESVTLVVGGEEKDLLIDKARTNDTVRIRPGELIPLDGEVIEGETSVDESSLTGESMPVFKKAGDIVSAGTLNFEGCIDVRVSRPATESTQAKIVRLIREAEKHRAPIIRVAERYAKWFTPSILILASLTWLVTGDIHRAVTLLIVGCPCAFVLATPTAVVAALGRAARQGVLLKGGKYLEAAREVDILAFDKTGTLTEGRPIVVSIWTANGFTDEDVLRVAASAESGSEHPLARAVIEEAVARGIFFENRSTETVAVGGMGIRARDVLVGSMPFLECESVDVDSRTRSLTTSLLAEGKTTLLVAQKGKIIGGLALQDKVREESAGVVAWADNKGMHTVLLSGDQEQPSRSVGEALKFREIRAALMPGDKQRYIKNKQEEGYKVAYVGDGTNDGPALAVAHLGISLASRRNNVALETADVVLMHQGLTHLPFLMELGRATGKVINQNLILFGLAFNATMLVLSASGFLTPILGALAHNAGSVFVVLNSARLLRKKIVGLSCDGLS
ncbi:MAG: cation-translocating P-type ATPase [Planctomycetota bacterium]